MWSLTESLAQAISLCEWFVGFIFLLFNYTLLGNLSKNWWFFNWVILGFPSQIFNFNRKPADEDKDDDLSDSEDSVYSGLEDSGSDSEEEEGSDDDEEGGSDDDEEEGSDDNDDKVKCKQIRGVLTLCWSDCWLVAVKSVLSVLLQNITWILFHV